MPIPYRYRLITSPHRTAAVSLLPDRSPGGYVPALLPVLSPSSNRPLSVFYPPSLRQGETVLHVAAAHGLARLVSELLRRGANANAATTRGEGGGGGSGEPHRQTAAHLAVQYRHRAVVGAILEHRRE